jgi:hypothetical protein
VPAKAGIQYIISSPLHQQGERPADEAKKPRQSSLYERPVARLVRQSLWRVYPPFGWWVYPPRRLADAAALPESIIPYHYCPVKVCVNRCNTSRLLKKADILFRLFGKHKFNNRSV